MRTHYVQSWRTEHLVGQAMTVRWTDSGGPHSVTFNTASAQRHFCHRSLETVVPFDAANPTATVPSLSLGAVSFASALYTAMSAVSAVITGVSVIDPVTPGDFPRYQITGSSAFTLTFTFATTAEKNAALVLGFASGTSASSATQTSSFAPIFSMTPAFGRANYSAPAVREGSIEQALTASGAIVTSRPTMLTYSASWVHQFENKSSVFESFIGSGRWCWQWFMNHAARGTYCVVADDSERLVFQAVSGFSRQSYTRRQPNMDSIWNVSIVADSVLGVV